MYNKQSCRECGAWLVPHVFCTACREHMGWICNDCGRIEDYAHVHECGRVTKKEIVVESAQG